MQGFNMGRYYPPNATNPPTFNTTHPLGARARKSTQGILTVRFELPFAVWCTHCKPEMLVGQGVRFNAEKKKVGAYYTTPIWSFRMKHTACGGWWEIRTDPKASEYVVVEGARRRDYGPQEKDAAEGEMRMLSEEERSKRREDAFAGLEGKAEEKMVERGNRERIEELLDASRVWEDPYTMNQKLRREFRGQRKAKEKEGRAKEGLQDKFSFGYEIVDEVESDGLRAGLVDFGGALEVDVAKKPLFRQQKTKAVESRSKMKKLKKEILAETSRKNLKETLVGNTRVGIDPFLVDDSRGSSKFNNSILPGLKRKRDVELSTTNGSSTPPTANQISTITAQNKQLSTSLVDYDSD